jgi:nucleoside phosphorylase
MRAFLKGLTGFSEQTARGLRVLSHPDMPAWLLAVTGQGKVEAALACQILQEAFSPSAYLLIGSAGALEPSLSVGDVVIGERSIEWDFQSSEDSDPHRRPHFRPQRPCPFLPSLDLPHLREGTILSADRNVFAVEEKARLYQDYGASAVAWEGAGFYRFLRRNGAEGWEIRVITETAREGAPNLPELTRRMDPAFPALRNLVKLIK